MRSRIRNATPRYDRSGTDISGRLYIETYVLAAAGTPSVCGRRRASVLRRARLRERAVGAETAREVGWDLLMKRGC